MGQTTRRYDGGTYPPDPNYSFCGLFIPAPMWETRQLNIVEKVVLAEIIYYEHSCPKNQFYRIVDKISFDLRITEKDVESAINVLVRNGLIKVTLDDDDFIWLESNECWAMSILSNSKFKTDRNNIDKEIEKAINAEA